MAKYTNLTSLFTAIADAIRAKKGTTGTIVADNFPEEIASIQSGGTVEQATPTITVSSGGLITATAGSKSATKQLTAQSSTTITPGTSRKTAVASSRYTTGAVYVEGDSDLVASNIVSGVTIFGVTGTATVALTASATVNHEYDIDVTVTGLNGRQPKYISWIDTSAEAAPHTSIGEDICNGMTAGWAALSSGITYDGCAVDAYGGKHSLEMTARVSGNTISMGSDIDFVFNGALIFTIVL